MANVTQWINSTVSFSNYTSPYNTSRVVTGVYSANHTTTAAITWTPATLLTPWPYLGGSMALSLLLCLWGVITNLPRKLKRVSPSSRRIRNATTNVALVFFTFRSVVAFVNGVRAMQLDQNARSMPPTALALMILSMGAYVGGTSCFAQLMLLFGDMLLVLTVFEMMFFNLLIGSHDAYGQWEVTGGNCPVVVKQCPALYQVGCGIRTNSSIRIDEKNIRAPFGPNKVGTGELVISCILNFAGILILVSAYFALRWLYMVLQMVGRVVRGDFSDFRQEEMEDDKRGEVPDYRWQNKAQKEVEAENERRDGVRWMAVVTIVALLLVAAVALPLHYVQQTKPSTFTVMDSFGPLVDYQSTQDVYSQETFDSAGSWSDCFEVSTPVDHFGFFEYWWDKAKDKPLEWLAVV